MTLYVITIINIIAIHSITMYNNISLVYNNHYCFIWNSGKVKYTAAIFILTPEQQEYSDECSKGYVTM